MKVKNVQRAITTLCDTVPNNAIVMPRDDKLLYRSGSDVMFDFQTRPNSSVEAENRRIIVKESSLKEFIADISELFSERLFKFKEQLQAKNPEQAILYPTIQCVETVTPMDILQIRKTANVPEMLDYIVPHLRFFVIHKDNLRILEEDLSLGWNRFEDQDTFFIVSDDPNKWMAIGLDTVRCLCIQHSIKYFWVLPPLFSHFQRLYPLMCIGRTCSAPYAMITCQRDFELLEKEYSMSANKAIDSKFQQWWGALQMLEDNNALDKPCRFEDESHRLTDVVEAMKTIMNILSSNDSKNARLPRICLSI